LPHVAHLMDQDNPVILCWIYGIKTVPWRNANLIAENRWSI
jgi:hypothetical protein